MTRDQQLIVRLLCGDVTTDKHGLPETHYLKEGSDEELEARRALARELRTSRPLDLGVRFIIGDFFDPDCGDEVERQIRFKYRHRGRPRQVNQEELETRRTLARELRTALPLNSDLRCLLAQMIDPDSNDVDKRIQFEHRRKGRRSNVMRENEIAEFIWAKTRVRGQMESAIKSVEERFGLKRRRTLIIWRRWQPILKRRKRTTPIRLSDWQHD